MTNIAPERHLLTFGHGFSGEAVTATCGSAFDRISGTTRNREKFDLVAQHGAKPVIFDGTVGADLAEAMASATHVLVSIAPDESGDPVLKACREHLASTERLQWIGYLSTVGVYGNHDGAWVDEETVCKPVSKRSMQRVAAEEAWQDFALKNHLPLAFFRLSGIYGPGRNTFMNIKKGKARRLVKPGQVFNRIRREDIGEAVRLAIALNAEGVFNITDDEPAPPQDLVTFACGLMGVEPPPETDFESADLTPMARSFYGENKRVSNRKSREVLGLDYAYPEYRLSLTQLWESGTWKG